MPFPCRLVDIAEMRSKGIEVQAGDMWFAPWYVEGKERPFIISDEYYRDWYGKRAPLVVVLPNGDRWMMDTKFGDGEGFKKNGWVITGEAPNVTASPSINCICSDHKRGYHGWLQNGVLSDDLEGREYSWRWTND